MNGPPLNTTVYKSALFQIFVSHNALSREIALVTTHNELVARNDISLIEPENKQIVYEVQGLICKTHAFHLYIFGLFWIDLS